MIFLAVDSFYAVAFAAKAAVGSIVIVTEGIFSLIRSGGIEEG